jgi:hypothetical protein
MWSQAASTLAGVLLHWRKTGDGVHRAMTVTGFFSISAARTVLHTTSSR